MSLLQQQILCFYSFYQYLRMISDSLATQPIFLCVDDTMVEKAGTRFENVSKLFDYAVHNCSNYLNGHCFVSIVLCIPVWKNDRMKYIPPFLYSFRWNIETSYYEQKTFWSLCRYMVRSCKGIEMLVNLINICYCAMTKALKQLIRQQVY